MARPRDDDYDFPDDEDAFADPEGPQACDLDAEDDDEDTPTVPCPHCGAEVAEFAQRCPHCGDWIVPGERSGLSPRGLLLGGIVFLLIVALLYWLL